MDTQKREKINRFLADVVMADAVKEVLRESFLKKREGNDINILASSMLAVYALEDGWKDLNKVRNTVQGEKKDLVQVGM